MAATSKSSIRWALPVVLAVVLLGGYFVAPQLVSADDEPELPTLTAEQLLAKVRSSSVEGVSGDVRSTPNLGLPELPQSDAGGVDWQRLLTSATDVKVAASDNGDVRLQLPTATTETVVVRNGQTLWIYRNDTNRVTKVALPAEASADAGTTATTVTPQDAARRFLDAVTPTTEVTVGGTSRVAGEAAYELVLTPKSTTSLISAVRIAVDSDNYAPLRVQVLSRGATTPAYETAYTSVSFDRPAASAFAFTPPAGATVTEQSYADRRSGAAPEKSKDHASPKQVGTGWDSVFVLPADAERAEAFAQVPTTATTPVDGGRLISTNVVNVVLLDDGRMAIGSTSRENVLAALR